MPNYPTQVPSLYPSTSGPLATQHTRQMDPSIALNQEARALGAERGESSVADPGIQRSVADKMIREEQERNISSGPSPSARSRQQTLERLNSRFSALGEAHSTLADTKKEFDILTAKGDRVTEDDLVNAAAKMVGLGADPNKIASMLATSPSGGPQLARWIQQQDQSLQKTQVQVLQVREQARQQLIQGTIAHFMQTIKENVPAPTPMQTGQTIATSATPTNPMMGETPNAN